MLIFLVLLIFLGQKQIMIYLGKNLKVLRKKHNLTQGDLANEIDVTRAVIGAYEEERAEPKLPTLNKLSKFFKVCVDDLINMDLENAKIVSIEGKNLEVLAVPVDSNNEELISLVPINAIAGYTNGYSDPEIIRNLPTFSLPIKEITKSKTYRAFQIKGNSMLPIHTGSYVLTEFVKDKDDIKDFKCYVIITREGIVYKRVVNNIREKSELLLISDNTEYEAYSIHAMDICEVWKAIGYISFDLPFFDKSLKEKYY